MVLKGISQYFSYINVPHAQVISMSKISFWSYDKNFLSLNPNFKSFPIEHMF